MCDTNQTTINLNKQPFSWAYSNLTRAKRAMSVVETSFKAKELLDSLVEPLTAQVHLLPAIHAQLGLPSSAIAADLDKLRAVLADAIEAQIQQRRSEVKGWLERCDKVERDCSVLAKSTGQDKSEKPPASVISEFRKINVSDSGQL